MVRSGRYDWLADAAASRQPFQSFAGGIAIILASLSLAAGFFILAGLLTLSGMQTGDARLVQLGLLTLILSPVGAFMGITVGRRAMQPGGLDVLERDPRSPILFLRSFFEDTRPLSDVPMAGAQTNEETVLDGLMRISPSGHEAGLAKAFGRLGPMVAIGKPGDRLALVGAARLYVDHLKWQEVVARLVSEASATVLQPDGTPGTSWELEYVIRNANPRRILLVIPNPRLRPLGYRRVRSLVAEVLPVILPEDPGPCDAFMFDDETQPIPLRLTGSPESGVRPFIDQIELLESEPAC